LRGVVVVLERDDVWLACLHLDLRRCEPVVLERHGDGFVGGSQSRSDCQSDRSTQHPAQVHFGSLLAFATCVLSRLSRKSKTDFPLDELRTVNELLRVRGGSRQGRSGEVAGGRRLGAARAIAVAEPLALPGDASTAALSLQHSFIESRDFYGGTVLATSDGTEENLVWLRSYHPGARIECVSRSEFLEAVNARFGPHLADHASH